MYFNIESMPLYSRWNSQTGRGNANARRMVRALQATEQHETADGLQASFIAGCEPKGWTWYVAWAGRNRPFFDMVVKYGVVALDKR